MRNASESNGVEVCALLGVRTAAVGYPAASVNSAEGEEGNESHAEL